MINILTSQIQSVELADLPGEEWKEIPGYNGKYLISQYSRVKSVIKKRPLILSRSVSSGHYKVVLIGKYGRLVSEDIGRLCTKVHLREIGESEVVEYIDNNKRNTQVSNIRLITWQESRKKTINRYRSSNVSFNVGQDNGRAKINEAKARDIRALRSQGLTYHEIARKHNISQGIVQRVIQNRTWKTA
ncbi:NUMOD4 domain-containing protein [Chryseobacterium arthrosphaerae]|uniref:NUMOD4 domain-containing protein n=1 Tax=Chryseobacterium arthrosphaerae TaxID=651561 RepID=UPI00241D76AF|nr:NUMOD4 domain-containing protein [Chryseobacterium arthrosphaerae]